MYKRQPFIHALRKAAPDAHITMLVDEKLKDVVLFNPYLDEVVTIDKKGRDNSILSLWACSRHLSKLDFDVLINLHPNERCSFIDAMTSVKLRTGTTHKIFKWFWDVFTPLDRSMHAADMYLDVLQQLGVQDLSNNGLDSGNILSNFFDSARVIQLICCVLESQIEKFFFSFNQLHF